MQELLLPQTQPPLEYVVLPAHSTQYARLEGHKPDAQKEQTVCGCEIGVKTKRR
jgi:hypothetical protein